MIHAFSTLYRRLTALGLGLTLAAAVTGAGAAEFGVSPMMIEMTGAPDVSQDFKVQVIGKTGGKAKVSLYELKQSATGHMDFIPVDKPGEESMAGWVTLEKTRFDVKKDEVVTLNGRIKVPRKAGGTHLAAVMVEEDAPAKKQGVTLNVRYAVILNMNVSSTTRGRIQTEFRELAIQPQNDRVFIKGLFTNQGKIDGMLDAELQLRDAANRLVLKTPLKTQSAWERSDKGSRVFPGSEVVIFGELPRSLPAGAYSATVRNRFSDRAQPQYRDSLSLPAEWFAPAAETPAAPASGTPPERTADQPAETPVASL